MRCAVPCLAVRSGAVLRCAFFRTHNGTRYYAKDQVRGTGNGVPQFAPESIGTLGTWNAILLGLLLIGYQTE